VVVDGLQYYDEGDVIRGTNVKAVILAGGLGTRMREETEYKPKPMVEIGGQPVLWHIMKLFSHYEVNEFVVLTGYKGSVINDFFRGQQQGRLPAQSWKSDVETFEIQGWKPGVRWKITLVDTGLETETADRLMRAWEHFGGDPFLCTYGDGLADVDIGALIEAHSKSGADATMTITQPQNRFGVVEVDDQNRVKSFREKPKMTDWINIGFFMFEPGFRKFLIANSPLEQEPLINLARNGKLNANRHHGFWEPMDTFREYQLLNSLWDSGRAPWKVW